MRKLWSRLSRGIPPLVIVLSVLFFWEISVWIWAIPNWLLPSPSSIGYALYDKAELIAGHTIVTLEEVIIGFAIAVISGILLASCIVLSKTLERALYPFVIASQTVPIIVIAPMLLVWIGYGLTPKVIVVALISFFPIVVNTVDGMKSIDPDMERMMRTMGAGRWITFRKVQVPTSIPHMFSGFRVAVAMSVIGAVIGEWVGSSEGLGYLMIRSKPQFHTELVFAAIVILSIMGVALFVLVGVVERMVVPWWYNQRK